MPGLKINSIRKVLKQEKVYDFEVEDAHHYILGDGVVSHNSYIPTQKMGGGCLIAGTKVQTPNGTVEIQNVRRGDVVSTLFGDRKVTETFEFQDKGVIEIEFEDGTKVECSEDHKFLVNGEWVTAGDLLDLTQNTESINIDVADINGTLDVYRKQIYENLLFVNAEGKAA